MSGSEKWFRWCFNLFIFLMCAQMGLLITLKSAYMKAESRLKENQAQVDFKCGDFQKDETYWNLPQNTYGLVPNCMDVDCPDSLWVNNKEEETELHVVSVSKARPTQMVDGEVEYGHFVDLKIQESQKPTILVLVSQGLMQWNFNPDEKEDLKIPNLKEVIVVGPELVWLQGLDKDTKITYFDREQLCAFPTAWEEIKNPQNQFRRLFQALKTYTGLEVKSFQGKDVGREFRIPFRKLLAIEKEQLQKRERNIASSEGLGLQWVRQGAQLQAQEYKFKRGGQVETIPVQPETRHAYLEMGNNTLFVIQNHKFGTWDWEKKEFKALHLPLKLPPMYWPTALTFNPMTSEIMVYNEDRGGEIFAYNVITGEWRQFAIKVGYSLMAMHFDTESEQLLGAQYFGRKISKIVRFNREGQSTGAVSLDQPVDFAKTQWKAQMSVSNEQLELEVSNPARPGGEIYMVDSKTWLNPSDRIEPKAWPKKQF